MAHACPSFRHSGTSESEAQGPEIHPEVAGGMQLQADVSLFDDLDGGVGEAALAVHAVGHLGAVRYDFQFLPAGDSVDRVAAAAIETMQTGNRAVRTLIIPLGFWKPVRTHPMGSKSGRV